MGTALAWMQAQFPLFGISALVFFGGKLICADRRRCFILGVRLCYFLCARHSSLLEFPFTEIPNGDSRIDMFYLRYSPVGR
jgi:hypothetical protein